MRGRRSALSGRLGDVVGPLLREDAAAPEQVRATIRGLDAVAVDVREGELADLPRRLGALGGQSRKLERNPCGTAPISSFRIILPIGWWPCMRPFWDGNTRRRRLVLRSPRWLGQPQRLDRPDRKTSPPTANCRYKHWPSRGTLSPADNAISPAARTDHARQAVETARRCPHLRGGPPQPAIQPEALFPRRRRRAGRHRRG